MKRVLPNSFSAGRASFSLKMRRGVPANVGEPLVGSRSHCESPFVIHGRAQDPPLRSATAYRGCQVSTRINRIPYSG